jgi:hypothetical protein
LNSVPVLRGSATNTIGPSIEGVWGDAASDYPPNATPTTCATGHDKKKRRR